MPTIVLSRFGLKSLPLVGALISSLLIFFVSSAPAAQAKAQWVAGELVITSYSIHYTKLYDDNITGASVYLPTNLTIYASSDIEPIPEPSTFLLLGGGLIGLGFVVRRKRKE